MGKKILVVDDEPHLMQLMTDMLDFSDEGFEVATAKDGQEALDKIRAIRPDLVLLDVRMPKKDGWQVCAEVRADPELKDLPIIILSAYSQKSDLERGKEFGVKEYLTKPCDPIKGLEAIMKALAEEGIS